MELHNPACGQHMRRKVVDQGSQLDHEVHAIAQTNKQSIIVCWLKKRESFGDPATLPNVPSIIVIVNLEQKNEMYN